MNKDEVTKFTKMISQLSIPREKSLVDGIVTRIDGDIVWVDVNGKAEGRVHMRDFLLDGFGQEPQVGQRVQIWLHELFGNSLMTSINFTKALQIRAKNALEEAYQKKLPLSGILYGKMPGGYIIVLTDPNACGARGFLPISQADPQMGKNPEILRKYKVEEHKYRIVGITNGLMVYLSRMTENRDEVISPRDQ
jgi:ribosomal protein S1